MKKTRAEKNAYQRAYQKTDKYKAYQKAYILKKKLVSTGNLIIDSYLSQQRTPS